MKCNRKKKIIESFKDTHEIGKFFYKNQQLLQSVQDTDGNGLTVLYSDKKEWNGYDQDGVKSKVFIKQIFDGDQKSQYYIKFAYFLAFLCCGAFF